MAYRKFIKSLGLGLIAGLLATTSFAEDESSIKYGQLEAGSILIATDKLNGSEFYHSVVYITQHSEHGTHGFIINKPTHMSINEAMPENMQLSNASKLYFGGPMHAQFLFVLTKNHEYPELHNVIDGLYFGAGDRAMIEINRLAHDATRTFIGFSNWGPGQLQKELDHEAWLVAPGSVKDIFDDHPEALWEKLFKQWSGDWI